MEEDDQSCLGTLCVNHHGEPASQSCGHSSVFPSDEDGRRVAACQRRRQLTRAGRRCIDGERSPKRQRRNPSPIKQSDAANNEENVDIQDQQEEKIGTERLDLQQELPIGNLPGKKWVIGPLLQSFKSKMASFTGIVMSPVRIFKSNNSSPPNSSSSRHNFGSNCEEFCTAKEELMDIGSDDKVEVCSDSQSKRIPQHQQRVVQRLVFDSDSSDVSDSKDKGTISLKRSESKRDTSSLSGLNSHPALTDGEGVHSDTPCSKTYSAHSLTLDSDERDLSLKEDATLGTSTRKSPRKEAKIPLECVAFRDSERSSLVKAAMCSDTVCAQTTVCDVPKPMENACSDKGRSAETSGSCNSSAREKMGQACRSRGSRKRDVKCRASASLEIVAASGNISSSFGVTKGAMATNVTDESCGGDSALAGLSPASALPPPAVTGEAAGQSGTAPQTRQCKNRRAMLCGASAAEDSHVPVESCPAVESPGLVTSPARMVGVGHRGSAQSTEAPSDLERTITARRTRVRQAKHKLETSDAREGPTTKKASIHSKRAGPAVEKKAARLFEEQRVSMSLTLQVDSAARGTGGLIPAPEPQWQAESLLKRCRTARRSGKVCALTGDGRHTDAMPEIFKDRPSVPECARDSGTPKNMSDQVDGRFRKSAISERVERETRRRGAPQVEEVEEGLPEAPASSSGSVRLMRSLSCPDIPSLQDGDGVPSAHVLPTLHRRSTPAHAPPHCPYKRTRRHTVCTVEVEREIAPLCLRKEVHPAGWAGGSGRVRPGSSPTVLASCFLSSPLAFLSSRSGRGWTDTCRPGAEHGDCSPPCSVQRASPRESSTAPESAAFSGPSACGPSSADWTSASLSSPCSVLEPVTLEIDEDAGQHGGEDDDCSTFEPELPPRAESEEKDSSHFEIKFQSDGKKVQRSKVSSIRIRKTLPKPQYQLTPMGLPKAVRIKKKVFSVEEIYTNKNFTQPPEGRLETIFEVPLSRRDGSQSLIGQKRVKRFVEFPEVGVARKPRKPLVGAAGLGGAQRKAVGNSGTGRTRRGVWASSRDEDALNLQELESLLCSKLNELDSWMALEQMVY